MGNVSLGQLPVELAPDYEYVVPAERLENLKRQTHGNHYAELDKGALHGKVPGELKSEAQFQGMVCNLAGQLLDGCSAGSGAKKNLAHAQPPAQVLHIVDKIHSLVQAVAAEKHDVLDQHWNGPSGMRPLHFLLGSTDPTVITNGLIMLSDAALRVLSADDTLAQAASPAKIVGDIHGQFRDILLCFYDFGFPSHGSETTFVFNGDWVDRGKHQLEVIVMVFALKIAYPDKVVLVRGNHEDPEMNHNMGPVGFYAHCLESLGQVLGENAFNAIHAAFEWLPLGCVVDQQILSVHGGIGSGDWSLNHLRMTGRPLNHQALSEDPVLWNILWSDPLEDEIAGSFGVHSSPRDNHHQIMKTFGKDVTAQFCSRNSLTMVVRSHQAKIQGKGYEFMHDGRLVRVFTARDYEGFQNDGCILDICRSESGDKLIVKPQVLLSSTKGRRTSVPGHVRHGATATHGQGCVIH